MIQIRSTPTGACSEVYSYCSPSARLQVKSRNCATNSWSVRGVYGVHIARPNGEAARVLSGSKTVARASKKKSESSTVKRDVDWLPTEVFSGLPQEDLSAAAKALGIQPSDIASTQSAIDEIMLVLQDETPLPDQLRLIKNDTLLKMCYNLDLTGLASAKKARLVAALDAALMNVKQGIVPEDKQPLNRAGSSAEQSSAGQVAAAEGSAGGNNGQIAMGSNGQAADATKGGPEGTSGGKVKAWEASTPDAAIEAADSLGYDGLIKLKRADLQKYVAALSRPYSKRTKAELVESLLDAIQQHRDSHLLQGGEGQLQGQPRRGSEVATGGLEDNPEDLMSVAGQPNKKVMSQGHAVEVSPKLAERDANTKDTGVPSEGSGDLPKRRRQRRAPVQKDIAAIEDEGPTGELGLDLPEMHPMTSRSVTSSNAADVDTDVVAQQRTRDKQSAVVAEGDEEEGDLTDVAMDEALLLNQEPSPEYDLDDEQRPRISRNADGDVTEVNFGNDDETLGRLEDMGVAGGGLAGGDVSRQNSGAAQRRRQASRLAAEDPEEEDGYGGTAAAASAPDSDGDSEPEEGELPIIASQGYGLESIDGLEDPDGSGNFLKTAELSEGFETLGSSSAAGFAAGKEEELLSDGVGMTKQEHGKARQQERMSQQYQDIDAIVDSQPQPKAEKARPPKKKQLDTAGDPTPTPTPTQASSSAAAPGPTPTPAITSQGAHAVQEMESEVDQGGAVSSESADDRGFAMPDWLATKYDSTSDPPANPSRPTTKLAASSFKPKRRKKKTPAAAADPPASDSLASDTHTPAQPARRSFFGEYVPYSWEEEDDTGGQTLEAGDLSPRGVDRDPRLTPEADDVIGAGVASVSPSVTQAESGSGRQQAGGIPNPPSIASGELSDVDVSLEGYEDALDDAALLQGLPQGEDTSREGQQAASGTATSGGLEATGNGQNIEATDLSQSGALPSPSQEQLQEQAAQVAAAALDLRGSDPVQSDVSSSVGSSQPPLSAQTSGNVALGAAQQQQPADLAEADPEQSDVYASVGSSQPLSGSHALSAAQQQQPADMGEADLLTALDALVDDALPAVAASGSVTSAQQASEAAVDNELAAGSLVDDQARLGAAVNSASSSSAAAAAADSALAAEAAAAAGSLIDDQAASQAAIDSALAAAADSVMASDTPQMDSRRYPRPLSPAVGSAQIATADSFTADAPHPNSSQYVRPVSPAVDSALAAAADSFTALYTPRLDSSQSVRPMTPGSALLRAAQLQRRAINNALAAAAGGDSMQSRDPELLAAEQVDLTSELAKSKAAVEAALAAASEGELTTAADTDWSTMSPTQGEGESAVPPSFASNSQLSVEGTPTEAMTEDMIAAAQADSALASVLSADPVALGHFVAPADLSLTTAERIKAAIAHGAGLAPPSDLTAGDTTAAAAQEVDQAVAPLKHDSPLSGSLTAATAEDIAAAASDEVLSGSGAMPASGWMSNNQSGLARSRGAFGPDVAVPPAELTQELAADLQEIQALRSQVAEKQATLAELDAQLGSTSAAAAENRDQIQRLQVQMGELQNEHVAWQRNMLDGRLQELRAAAAQVENNQALQVDLQQQVRGMSDQLASLEASLMASDDQAGRMRQELASFSNGPPTFKVNGTHMNGGATSANLPKGYYYTLADVAPTSSASSPQQQQSQSGESAEGSDLGEPAPLSDEVQSTASTADASTSKPGFPGDTQEKGTTGMMAASQSKEGTAGPHEQSLASEGASRADSKVRGDQEKRPNEVLVAENGRGKSSKESSTSSTEPQASQPGVAVAFGVMTAAEVGKATANFFSGLFGRNKPNAT